MLLRARVPPQARAAAAASAAACPAGGAWRPGRAAVRARRAAAAAGAPPPNAQDETDAQRALVSFVTWAVANGVWGIGLDDSKVALYDDAGERGLMAMQPLSAGEVVLKVPLRLALTDHPGDEDSNALMYEGAPWSVRLAGKLLREVARGHASAWAPYLQVLPASVPSPLQAFTWEDMQMIEWQPAQAELYSADWLVSDAYERCTAAGHAVHEAQAATDAQAPLPNRPDLPLGGASLERFKWAISVVHSRTFANAARTGGVGVRMLVPIVDMLNHGGDVTASGLMHDGNIVATDNVRWDVAPPSSPGAGWAMHVSATRPVPAGQQLVLSYGERASDDFFIHYGFVPPLCNPHEDAVVFEDLEEALEWHHEQFGGQLSETEAAAVYGRALAKAQQEQAQALRRRPVVSVTGAAARSGFAAAVPPVQGGGGMGEQAHSSSSTSTSSSGGGDGDGSSGDEAQAPGWQQLKVHAGGRVAGPLMTAFCEVAAVEVGACGSSGVGSVGNEAALRSAERAVARRCRQLLRGMPTPLLHDLWRLRADACSREGAQEEAERLGRIAADQAERERTRPAADAAAEAGVPLAPNARLCVQLRAAKKLVLWGCAAGAGSSGSA